MSLDERDLKYLWDMLEAARCTQSFVQDITWVQYEKSRLIQAGVERELEIIGEASRRISESLRAAHPEIPWKSIIAQRNVVAHEYGTIKQEKLWLVITESIPVLIPVLESLVNPYLPENEV